MKSKKLITILLIICLIALVIVGVVYYNVKKGETQEEKFIDPKEDEVLNLSGFGIFFDEYSGYLKSSEIAKHLEKITITYLPEMFDFTKDFNEEEISEHYFNNVNVIRDNLGIENVEDFTAFLQRLQVLDEDLSTWYRLDILEETFEDESDKENYAYVEYEVSFKNDHKIKFSLYVSKVERIEPTYIIDVID